MGAHIGHLHVEAFDSLSYYILGTRSFFIIFDLHRTVSYIKNALLFFEHVVSNFGNSLFCYSGVSMLNIHIKLFFIQLIKDKNQSFSYWRWAPGCITNYRTVFLRLVNYLFSYTSSKKSTRFQTTKHRFFNKFYSKYLYKDQLSRIFSLSINNSSFSDSSLLRSFFLRHKNCFSKFSIKFIRYYELFFYKYFFSFFRFFKKRRRNYYDYRNEKHVNMGSLTLEEVAELKKIEHARVYGHKLPQTSASNKPFKPMHIFSVFLYNTDWFYVYRYKIIYFYFFRRLLRFLRRFFFFKIKFRNLIYLLGKIKKFKSKFFYNNIKIKFNLIRSNIFSQFNSLLNYFYLKNRKKKRNNISKKKKRNVHMYKHKYKKKQLNFFKFFSFFRNHFFSLKDNFVYSNKYSLFLNHDLDFELQDDVFVSNTNQHNVFIKKHKKYSVSPYLYLYFRRDKKKNSLKRILHYGFGNRLKFFRKKYDRRMRRQYGRPFNLNAFKMNAYDVLSRKYNKHRKKYFLSRSRLNKKHFFSVNFHKYRKIRKRRRKFVKDIYRREFSINLPSFLSMLIRIFYVTKNKFDDLLIQNNKFVFDEEVFFQSVYARFFLFWRAIIFFKCFKKTIQLPDCLIFLNPDNQLAQLNDFCGVNVPIISVADSNSYIHYITYPIPSNDDSLILLLFYFLLFLNACDSGMQNRYSSLLL